MFLFWHLERLVICDDEPPAVSALSRSDLKMAERPKAKLSGKVGIHGSVAVETEREGNTAVCGSAVPNAFAEFKPFLCSSVLFVVKPDCSLG